LDALEVSEDFEAALRRVLVVEFKFPGSADLLSAGATFVHPVAPVVFRRRGRRDSELREGPTTFLDIAPGLVRLRRTDPNRAARTVAAAELRRDTQLVARAALIRRESPRLLHRQRMDAWAARDLGRDTSTFYTLADSVELSLLDAPVAPSQRGLIAAWSSKSRARMVSTICELDLSVLVAGEHLPGMLTLTLPGDWLAVAPGHAVMARKFDNFLRSWADKFGEKSANIWKREFQRRGAPHYHLWLVPPVMAGGLAAFREWVALAWTTALDPSRAEVRPGGLLGPVRRPTHGDAGSKSCSCSEWCRSVAAGTGLDFAEAMRARDPRRLAVYFLKESLGGESKAYQNSAPVEWLGGWLDHSAGVQGPQPSGGRPSMGRFWGVRGIEKSVMTVELESSVGVQVARMMRRWQRAQGITREVRAQRIGRTGTVRRRPQRRRARVVGAAGWVAVNDGASFAAGAYTVKGVVGGLSRMVERLTAQLLADRAHADLWQSEPVERDSMPVHGFVPIMHGPFRDGQFYAGPPLGHYPQPRPPLAAPVVELDEESGAWSGDTMRNWLAMDPNKGWA